MKRAEAEKLLGGYATGTLTGDERRALFEAALERQDVFDTLADEEALRELLADPEVRGQLLAALAPVRSRVVPFWRRPGVIGIAAGLLVATTAGLVVLRSPETTSLPPAKAEVAQAPAPSASAPASPEAKTRPSPAPKGVDQPRRTAVPRTTAAADAPVPEAPAQVSAHTAGAIGAAIPTPTTTAAPIPSASGEEARKRTQAEMRQMGSRDQMSKQADAAGTNRAAAVVEVVSPEAAPARRMAAKAAPAPTGLYAPQPPAPVWTLEALADGTTRVTVVASPQAQVVLLRRGASGVEVLKPGAAEPWQFRLRLAPGDALDLYVLNGPVVEPGRLPPTGPVDGFRVRIHPPAKK